MTDLDKGQDETPETDEELPGDEQFDEEPEEAFEGEADSEGPEASATAVTHRRFTLGRGGHFDEEPEKRQQGSVKGTHERVHIDDRPSIVYALVCAIGLIVVILLPWLGGAIPKSAGPVLTPLIVPTAPPSASVAATPTVSIAPSASVAPTASPSPAPSATAS